jgi:hypothetical protein
LTADVVAATAAHWFERPASYAEAHRILVPGAILAIVEYVRDRERSPIAAALIEFMVRYGSERAYAPPDYHRELAEAPGFGAFPRHRKIGAKGTDTRTVEPFPAEPMVRILFPPAVSQLRTRARRIIGTVHSFR